MLNIIWFGLILGAVVLGVFTQRWAGITDGAIEGARDAVSLALGLIGIMALWLGLMRLADQAGLVRAVAHALRPVFRRLFPDVPADHPAIGSMVMNLAANMLGLTNAATPLGLRAMKDLESLNRTPGTATNAMCTFLAINTSSVQLFPVTAVAVLAVAGSSHPTAIVGTALLATLCSTAAGIAAVKWLERLRWFRLPVEVGEVQDGSREATAATVQTPASATGDRLPLAGWKRLVLAMFLALFGGVLVCLVLTGGPEAGGGFEPAGHGLFARVIHSLSLLAIPFLVALLPLYALLKGVPVYEEFVVGAREGFEVAIRIIPYLVAMLVAIAMFRAAGGIDLLSAGLGPALRAVGFPVELLPMALLRPLTGSGTLALFSELANQLGPDALVTRMAGTLFGSTETTFYVVVVYFGSVGIRKTRHAILAGLIADAVGVVASVAICRWVFA